MENEKNSISQLIKDIISNKIDINTLNKIKKIEIFEYLENLKNIEISTGNVENLIILQNTISKIEKKIKNIRINLNNEKEEFDFFLNFKISSIKDYNEIIILIKKKLEEIIENGNFELAQKYENLLKKINNNYSFYLNNEKKNIKIKKNEKIIQEIEKKIIFYKNQKEIIIKNKNDELYQQKLKFENEIKINLNNFDIETNKINQNFNFKPSYKLNNLKEKEKYLFLIKNFLDYGIIKKEYDQLYLIEEKEFKLKIQKERNLQKNNLKDNLIKKMNLHLNNIEKKYLKLLKENENELNLLFNHLKLHENYS